MPLRKKKTVNGEKTSAVQGYLEKPVKVLGARKGTRKPVRDLPTEAELSLNRGGRPKVHDWDAIREWYIEQTAQPTWTATARQFGVNHVTVTKKGNQERWPYLRAQHHAERIKKRREKHGEWAMEQSVKFDESSLDTAKLGMALVTQRLVEIQKMYSAHQHLQADFIKRLESGQPWLPKEKWGVVDYRELESLARAALTFQEIGRKALGTDALNIDLSVDGEISVEEVVHIGETLSRDDPDRIAQLLEAAERAGLLTALLGEDTQMTLPSGAEILEAEIVEDEEEEEIDEQAGQG